MSNAQNKRAAQPHQDEPAKKRGRPSKAALDSMVPADSMSRVQAREMLERHPELNYSSQDEPSFYDELVPWPKKHDWSDKDNTAVDREWNRSEVKKESSKALNTCQYAALYLLFKISLRLYRTTPIALLSPVYGLRYQPVSKVANRWIMAGTFCETLSGIMVHPCWEEDTASLAIALGWAVICRLDSRTAWEVSVEVSCPVIQRTFDKIQGYGQKSLDKSYHDLHKAERERASARGESLSWHSDILYALGEAVPKEQKKRPDEDSEYFRVFGRNVLPVTKWDLDVLAQVVNSMDFEPQWNYGTQEALLAWKIEVSRSRDESRTELPRQERLSLIYQWVHLSIFRHIRLLDRQLSPSQGTEETDADDSQNSDPASSSDDTGSHQETSSPQQMRRVSAVDDSSRRPKRRRQRIVEDSGDEDSSDEEYVGLRRLPIIRHGRDVNDAEEEHTATVRPDVSDARPLPEVESGVDDDMTNIFDDGLNLDFDGFVPHVTEEVDECGPYGPTLAESFPPGRRASPVYASLREKKMLSELSELRKENKELRDGQKQLQDLFTEGQKEQKQLILDMKLQLDSMQSELSQLRQSKEAPNQGAVVQSHPERLRPPGATVIDPRGATNSPELGTDPSAPRNDVRIVQETINPKPAEEDITPEPPVPKRKTPEPERSEQQATDAPEVIQNAPEQNASKQKTPEPEQSQQQDDTVEVEHLEQLSDQSRQALAPRAGVKVSSQNLTKDVLRGLAQRPVKKERRIGSMTGLVSGQTPISGVQRDIFKTPRTKVLKIIK
ncbi:uncharacterized protein FSUBG_13438 [Fusarium subglutinans]|uniref:Uncharacterized protein n=1 Tax=Gibberella subglutinans TaxID=42677 RepID=A0A8H5NYG9_GIBSU|nr:uncharacterized protein FSUBG_13438 [Fusarium subglutinans]KAF5580285.1 hypothetical protein FSUBG_13438 [Fusarium subglutinans]